MTIQDPRIIHWKQGDDVQNFGDFLTVLMAKELFLFPRVSGDIYRIVGSCISEWMIWEDLLALGRENSGRVVYWGCGLRDETPLNPAVFARSRFYGVRGPLSRDVLGLPPDTPLADPGLLAPLFHQPRKVPELAGRVLCMPHINDPTSEEDLLTLGGADTLIRPTVANTESGLRNLLNQIASADFLLTGSLHGAILACAYGVPFAFWDTGHVDITFKWRDFAGSINIPTMFVRNVAEGRKAFDDLIKPVMQRPSFFDLLEMAPFEIKPSVLIRALQLDGELTGSQGDAAVKRLKASQVEAPSVIDRIRRDNLDFEAGLAAWRDLPRHALEGDLAARSQELELVQVRLGEALQVAANQQSATIQEKSELERARAEAAASIQEGLHARRLLEQSLTDHMADFKRRETALASELDETRRLLEYERASRGEDQARFQDALADLNARTVALDHDLRTAIDGRKTDQEAHDEQRRADAEKEAAIKANMLSDLKEAAIALQAFEHRAASALEAVRHGPWPASYATATSLEAVIERIGEWARDRQSRNLAVHTQQADAAFRVSQRAASLSNEREALLAHIARLEDNDLQAKTTIAQLSHQVQKLSLELSVTQGA